MFKNLYAVEMIDEEGDPNIFHTLATEEEIQELVEEAISRGVSVQVYRTNTTDQTDKLHTLPEIKLSLLE